MMTTEFMLSKRPVLSINVFFFSYLTKFMDFLLEACYSLTNKIKSIFCIQDTLTPS